jgi:hypothetical protein
MQIVPRRIAEAFMTSGYGFFGKAETYFAKLY